MSWPGLKRRLNNSMDTKPSRKTPAHLPIYSAFNRALIVFVTVCTNKKKDILCREKAHELILDAWRRSESWEVGCYIVMSDHIHLFVSPSVRDYPELKKWVQYWKMLVSREWPWPDEQPIWQKSFWDTQLRTGERYSEKWEYVRQNPVRKGLVTCPENWPYHGELNTLYWHD